MIPTEAAQNDFWKPKRGGTYPPHTFLLLNYKKKNTLVSNDDKGRSKCIYGMHTAKRILFEKQWCIFKTDAVRGRQTTNVAT